MRSNSGSKVGKNRTNSGNGGGIVEQYFWRGLALLRCYIGWRNGRNRDGLCLDKKPCEPINGVPRTESPGENRHGKNRTVSSAQNFPFSTPPTLVGKYMELSGHLNIGI